MVLSSVFIDLAAGVIAPEIFPKIIRGRYDSIAILFWSMAFISLGLGYLACKRNLWTEVSLRYIYFSQGFGLLIFMVTLSEMMVLIAPVRSSQEIAVKALPYIPQRHSWSYRYLCRSVAILPQNRQAAVGGHPQQQETHVLGQFL